MSYGTKYYCQFMDYYDNLINVDFDFKDYSGDSTKLKCREGSGHIYQPEQTENVFHPMRGSEFSIDLLSTTNFALIDFYVANKREVKVTVTKAGSTIWVGWLVPNKYSEPYIAPPYFVTITALDGLGELQTYNWEWKNTMTPMFIISYCLKKNQLDLDIWESVNLYEESMSTGVGDTPLNACYFPTRKYYGMSCYDVLSDLLTGLGAEIQQVGGAWKITRIRELTGTLYKRQFNASAALLGDATEDPVKLVGLVQDNKLTGYSHELFINPGVHSMYIKRLYEKKPIFFNSDFSDYDAGSGLPNDWLVSTPLTGQRIFLDQKSTQEFNDFSASQSESTKSLFQRVKNFKQSTILGVFRLNLSVEIAVTATDDTAVIASMKVRVIFTGDSGTIYYLDADGSWSTSLTNIYFKNIDCNKINDIEWKTLNITGAQIPEDGELAIYLFAPYKVSGSGTLNKWYLRKCAGDVYNTIFGNYDDYGFLLTETMPRFQINQNMTFIPQFEIEWRFGDFPDTDNMIPIYYNGLYRTSFTEEPTTVWSNRGGTESKTLYAHLTDDYIKYFTQAKWIIRGDILTKTIGFDSVLLDYGVSNKTYYCKGGTWNLNTSVFSGVFHEIGAYSGSNWILAGGTWDDDGIWIDDETWNDSDPTP